MKLSSNIASKLLQLAGGAELPASSFSAHVVKELVEENLVQQRIQGRTKRMLYIVSPITLYDWLAQKHGINNLEEYVNAKPASRADNIAIAGDSKHTGIRTFKGFLVNTCQPIVCALHGEPFTVNCTRGTFLFVSDFESFIPPVDTIIAGVENAEVFSNIHKLQHLLPGNTLFVSRYPQNQSKDLQTWLKNIPNQYLHLGDYDFAGLNIFSQEYKRHLGDRATLYIPHNLEDMLQQHGNPAIYDQQKFNTLSQHDPELQPLISLLNKYKKGLEQEVLLKN